jgi:nucleotide-binding universal stress UspA family protein
MFQKIMVAYDESPEAGRALQIAIGLAKALGADLKVVTVLEPLPSYLSYAASAAAVFDWEDEKRARYTALQEQARKQAAAAGLYLDSALIPGDEVESIIECAQKHQSDRLVLGMRKHGLLIGHTGQQVAERSPCAVLGVR